jgi:Inhibitor of growth proteins N-terminal histone-binding
MIMNDNSAKSDMMQQLQQEFINRTEERVLQLKVVKRDDDNGIADGRQVIGLQVPNEAAAGAATTTTATAISNTSNDDSMEVEETTSPKKKNSAANSKKKSGKQGTKRQREKEKIDAVAAAAAAKDDINSNHKDNEDIRIPTTEELWDYATGQVDISNATSSNNDNDNNNNNNNENSEQPDPDLQQHHRQHQHQHHHHDDYYKILQLHQECLQKADEKVAVARQAYEMVDSVVQRLDRDLGAMESLLQVL